MDDTDISLASGEADMFLDLREAQRSLWDPADGGYKNRGTRSTANEPVWPSGKAGKQRDLGSNLSASALLSLQKLWSVDIVL